MTGVQAAIRREVDPLLIAAGFRRKRSLLYEGVVADGRCYINISSDRLSTPVEATITAHVGFRSNLLEAEFGAVEVEHLEAEWMHWYRWVGFVTDEDSSRKAGFGRWQVDVRAQSSVTRGVGAAIELALRATGRWANDHGVRDLWLAERDPFLPEGTQCAYLAVLLKELGPQQALAEIATMATKVLKGRPDPMARRAIDIATSVLSPPQS